MRFVLYMNIQNYSNNQTSFKGYDARRLKALVMNTNYAGIADEVKKIGDIENFKVFLIEKNSLGFNLKSDKFELSKSHNGAWAQDTWGIVKNTLLARDNMDSKTQFWRALFNLEKNSVQVQTQEELGLNNASQYVDLLYNLPIVNKNGKEFVQVLTDDGIVELSKSVLDAELKVNVDILKNISNQCHIKGGNYFLTKGQNGEDELLIGQNELKKFSIAQLKEMFQTDNIHVIPQADYHLDLFIRPLKDKKVLVADDEMMSKLLDEGLEKVTKLILSKPQSEREQYRNVYINLATYANAIKNILGKNPYANMKDIEQMLIKSGYEPIKVPGRLFEIYGEEGDGSTQYVLKQLHNYINAIVHVNDKGETVYITNKSTLDDRLGLTKEIQKETDFSLEKAFSDAVKPYVDKIYFVSGEENAIGNKLLPEYYGGIHCMTMEVPK